MAKTFFARAQNGEAMYGAKGVKTRLEVMLVFAFTYIWHSLKSIKNHDTIF